MLCRAAESFFRHILGIHWRDDVQLMLQRFLAVLVVVAAALSGCGDDGRAASGASTPDEPRPATASVRLPPDLSGRIAFQSDRTGRAKIFVLDHQEVRQVTRGPGDDMNPKWSPDGTRIAFFSNRDGNEEIYVVDADGGNVRRLTSHPADDRNPAWSPDGRFLAFDSERAGDPTLWVMTRDGNDPRRVTDERRRIEAIPAWSPDGRWLALSARRRGSSWRVAAVRPDGSGYRIVASAEGDCRPAFSPDGASVAFVSMRADGKGDIWTVGFAGGEPRRVTTADQLYDYHPSWSPDGRHIAFAAGPDKERYNLYVVGADGTGRRQLTFGSAHDAHPSWTR